jgi:hypothetical protein
MKITSINKKYTKNHDNIACNIDSAITNHVIDRLYEKLHSLYSFEFKKNFALSMMEKEETILQIARLKDNKVEINPSIIEQINKGLSDIASEREKMLEEIAEKTGLPLEKSEE